MDVIVVGVSLGGVDALRTLLGGLPADFGVPVAIVQHRNKMGKDGLDHLLGRFSGLPVVEIEDKMPVAPGSVYLAPQDYHTLLERSRDGDELYFSLSLDAPESFARPSIDALFETAAVACGNRCVGIILTGANSDGARGLKAIHQCGGTAIVQEPDDAHCPTMPRSALDAVPSALRVPMGEIASLLKSL